MRYIETTNGRALLMESPTEINKGMSIYADNYRRTGNLPTDSMLFPLMSKYSNFTMSGVPFALSVTYLDDTYNVIQKFNAYPNTPDSPIPPNTYWMLEYALPQ